MYLKLKDMEPSVKKLFTSVLIENIVKYMFYLKIFLGELHIKILFNKTLQMIFSYYK